MHHTKLALKIVIPLFLSLSTLASADEWEFRLTPYIWFAGVEGDVSTLPGAPVVPIEISPSDALSDTEASFMVMFEAKKQRHGVLVDLFYSDIQSDDELIPAINLTMKSISKNKMFSTAYLYELYKEEQTVVDVVGGIRYWKVDTELKFSGGKGDLAGRRIRSSESWVDPLIGIKARSQIGSSQFYVAGGLAGGGFGVGSDHFYELSANIGYQWSKAIGTSLGYRRIDVDYEDGSFLYDVKQDGWALGLTWSF